MASSKRDTARLAPWAEPAFEYIHSPYYSASHRKLRNELRTYVEEKILPYSLDWEAAGGAPREEALKWVRSGFAHVDIPKEYRPADLPDPAGIPVDELDAFHFLLMTDQTSRALGGVMTSLSGASVIGAPPVVHYGTEEQRRKWLPGLFTWETSFCLGITEPGAGSDVANIVTKAVKTEDGTHYVVNGTKKFITGIPWATHMTTAVRTGGPGMGGISVLVIPLSTPGITHRRIPHSGQTAGGASWVDLEDVHVPISNLLGRENSGFKIIMTNFNRERFVMAVGCNRMARECLTTAFNYAHTRHTFGRPLAANQIIRHKLAMLARDVEAHWAWLEQIAYHVKCSETGWEGQEIAGRIALAKVMGGQTLERAAREAQQVLGGVGYQRGGVGGRVEQITRDLRMMVVGGGSEEILEDLAVRIETLAARKRGWKL
ncbi:acyl-CoA dehydrogenase NM domain-like protein [Trichodelitschia bisporula]|uniref:Acyl-CoA dehydrogenase NM domain-like protein n=1 Tax=Trichodelitschia bisporula TaxID=703511 RepID=A0A6G1I4A2_9PEZI|nr:acyl-CoA dehydrogenase NM domain-like protein [Trichodelitschia bisporula]